MKGEVEWILSVAVPRPLEGLFTYRLPPQMVSQIRVGGWVRVPFGRTVTHAFVVEPPKPFAELTAGIPPDSLKTILEAGDPSTVISADVLELCKWTHDYYFAPIGDVINCAAPAAALGLKSKLQKARPIPDFLGVRRGFDLTPDQVAALDKLEAVRSSSSTLKAALLQGVTGSGKTELYIELARRTLAEGRGVILLVPEIALTSQLHQRFEEGLGCSVGLWHSAVADGKRRDLMSALASGKLRAVVGVRSAVFASVPNLGLIVVDEEHDPTYKQEDRVRYNARDLAVVRAKITGAMALLGSATPSLESRERCRENRYVLAELPKRIGAGGFPEIEVVDLRVETRVEKVQAPLAVKTLKEIQKTIDDGGQAIVFLNRRGFAAFLICSDCGDTRECPNCSISLTVHLKRRELRCHVCHHRESIPDYCRKCTGLNLEPMGAGTESLEADLPRLLQGARPLRLDRDMITSTRRLEETLKKFRDGEANLLLGTQMLVKGHDFPGVTLVVVVLADGLFRWPDFRAPERAYQILRQVAGRAGRGEKPGRVLIQTYDPEHAVILTVTGQTSEEAFLEGERELRESLSYPPFGRVVRLRFEDPAAAQARSRAETVAGSPSLQRLRQEGKIEILGPSEAFLERAKGICRWDILIKSKEVMGIQRAIFAAREICQQRKWNFLVDVDPYGVG